MAATTPSTGDVGACTARSSWVPRYGASSPAHIPVLRRAHPFLRRHSLLTHWRENCARAGLLRRYWRARRWSDPRRLSRDNLPAVRTLRAAGEYPEDVQMVVEHLSGSAVAEIDDTFRNRGIAVNADRRVAELHELGDARPLNVLQDLGLGFRQRGRVCVGDIVAVDASRASPRLCRWWPLPSPRAWP